MGRSLKVAGAAFVMTLGTTWLPWLLWFAIDGFVLGHADPKLGRDANVMLGIFVRGASAFVSATLVAMAYGIQTQLPTPLAGLRQYSAILTTSAILAVLCPLVPSLRVPGVQGTAGLVATWALLSLACVISVWLLLQLTARRLDPASSGETGRGA